MMETRKRKRSLRACDRCHRLGRKCRLNEGDHDCQLCQDNQEVCAFERPTNKRGPKSSFIPDVTGVLLPSKNTNLPFEVILELAQVYRNTVYPIYCFFHWPTFIRDIQARRHDNDPAFHGTVISVCLIAMARMRDGAMDSRDLSHDTLSRELMMDIRTLRNTARGRLVDLSKTTPVFDDLRTAALLAILAIQDGDLVELQLMLGVYMGISAILSFHDEDKWPEEISETRKQEMRALFWSTYTTDVLLAMIWNGVVRHQVHLSSVEYPDERLDGDVQSSSNTSGSVSWVHGWNTVTDLYRSLDRIIHLTRPVQGKRTPSSIPDIFVSPATNLDWREVISSILKVYNDLPGILKTVQPFSGVYEQDIYSFQAANLGITLQAIKMYIVCAGTLNVEMTERCQVAGELLDTLANIPTAYLKVVSAPLYHQLASIGSLLGGVVNGPLIISNYIQVRQILLSFATLLGSLESTLNTPAGLSDRIMQHVSRIDTFMRNKTDSSKAGYLFTQGGHGHLTDTVEHYGNAEVSHLNTSPLNHIQDARNGTAGINPIAQIIHQNDGTLAYALTSSVRGDLGSTSTGGDSELGNLGAMENGLGSWRTSDPDPLNLPDELTNDWPLDIEQQALFASFFANHIYDHDDAL